MGKRSNAGRGDEAPGVETLKEMALRSLEKRGKSRLHLRRLLLARIARRHGEAVAKDEELRTRLDAVLGRLEEVGLLDDRAYASARARSLVARGTSLRRVAAKLRSDLLAEEVIDDAMRALRSAPGPDPDWIAALRFARRRRIGPFRDAAGGRGRQKELAALARAGFTYPLARRVVEHEDRERAESILEEAEIG